MISLNGWRVVTDSSNKDFTNMYKGKYAIENVRFGLYKVYVEGTPSPIHKSKYLHECVQYIEDLLD